MARVLAIGDIHGQYEKLVRALEASRYAESDQLIFLGDYIDRGPDSKRVLDFMLRLKRVPANIFLRGNHEQMLLHLLSGKADYLYMWLDYSFGRDCLASYGHDPASVYFEGDSYWYRGPAGTTRLRTRDETSRFIENIFPESHLHFLQYLQLSHETDCCFFSHAGVQKDVVLAEQGLLSDCFLIWGDQEFFADSRDYGKTIVFGHFHLDHPYLRPGRIGIAMENEVAVADLTNQVLYSSGGRTEEIACAGQSIL